jgi:hypothetical protein
VVKRHQQTLAVSNSPQTYTGSGQATTVTISSSSVPGAVSNILTGAATQTNGTLCGYSQLRSGLS